MVQTFRVATPYAYTLAAGTSTLVLPTNYNRLWCILFNDAATTAYLQLGSAAVASEGIRLASGAGYELNTWNLWIGEIYAISAAGGVLTAIDVSKSETPGG